MSLAVRRVISAWAAQTQHVGLHLDVQHLQEAVGMWAVGHSGVSWALGS